MKLGYIHINVGLLIEASKPLKVQLGVEDDGNVNTFPGRCQAKLIPVAHRLSPLIQEIFKAMRASAHQINTHPLYQHQLLFD